MTDATPELPGALGPATGFGLDVESLERWRGLAADPVAWERIARSFTAGERTEIAAHRAGVATAAAGRWVAKEAVLKAIGDDRLGVRDVEVRRDGAGLVVAAPTLAGRAVLVSVSYTPDHAFAAAWVADGADDEDE